MRPYEGDVDPPHQPSVVHWLHGVCPDLGSSPSLSSSSDLVDPLGSELFISIFQFF